MHREETEEASETVDDEHPSLRASANFDENQYKETASVFVQHSLQTTVEALSVARNALRIRNNGNFVSDYEGDLLAMAYPDLFPYGRGHPGISRRVPVSFDESWRYYLRISGRSFAQNTTFVPVLFNICGKRHAALSTMIRARHQTEDFESIGSISREDLAEALSREKKRRCHHRAKPTDGM